MFYLFSFVVLLGNKKPNREDEYARIEASGGKVIQWNGYRVFGVLAMSRSIGTNSTVLFLSLLLYFELENI